MPPFTDWKPTAATTTLQLRARFFRELRAFFDTRGYWEVDTPLLAHERVVDPNLAPFLVLDRPESASGSRPGADLFLQTSPEFAMKRLLAAGADAIYQVGHVFRQGERGRLHNPEFMMVEWYRAGTNHLDQMQTVEELIRTLRGVAAGRQKPQPYEASFEISTSPFARTTYREAFVDHTGIDPFDGTIGDLARVARERGLLPPASLTNDDRDGWLNYLLAELVEPQLGRSNPEFVYDYPASQAALARVRPGRPAVSERFELYINGIEICNGYHELTDATELRLRVAAESNRRSRDGLPALPLPVRLLSAMEAGIPSCAGVALGFDRLLMLLVGETTIDAVLPFTFERA